MHKVNFYAFLLWMISEEEMSVDKTLGKMGIRSMKKGTKKTNRRKKNI